MLLYPASNSVDILLDQWCGLEDLQSYFGRRILAMSSVVLETVVLRTARGIPADMVMTKLCMTWVFTSRW
jgi:hypothetical protein